MRNGLQQFFENIFNIWLKGDWEGADILIDDSVLDR